MPKEPKLKYSAIPLETSCSCLKASSKFIAIGTYDGKIQIMDLLGFLVKEFHSHSAQINQLHLDDQQEYILSCSDDGLLIIHALYTADKITLADSRPLKTIAFEPEYLKKLTRGYIYAGLSEKLILSSKGWFGNKETILHSGDGPIYNCIWKNNIIIWFSDAGIRFYDVEKNQKFGLLPTDSSVRPDLFHCHMAWEHDTLYVAWGDSVKIIIIKDRSKFDIASGMTFKYFEILYQFKTPFLVAGIAPFEKNEMLLLSFIGSMNEFQDVDVLSNDSSSIPKRKSEPPELNIVNFKGEIIANDVLSIPGHSKFQCKDYNLDYNISDSFIDSFFYIKSPKNIIIARPRNTDDHIEWLISIQNYQEALKLAQENGGEGVQDRLGTILQVGQKYIQNLMDEERYEEAAHLCPQVLRLDPHLWESWIYKFADCNQLTSIYPFIPTQDIEIKNHVYELVLTKFLENDHLRFLQALDHWPSDIYNLSTVIFTLEQKSLLEPSNLFFNKGLMKLYVSALKKGLSINYAGILSLIHENNLYAHVGDLALEIMNYDEAIIGNDLKLLEKGEGLSLLLVNKARVPIEVIVQSIKIDSRYLYLYLHGVFQRDSQLGSAFHYLQTDLYAKYDTASLMEFLQTSLNYDITEAYEICEKQDLVSEMVFLLGKMGNNKRALMLLIERIGDVKRAIDFAKSQNDEDLWEDLLKYSMDKPEFIVGLLENLGGYIDPLRIVSKIPKSLKIQRLKPALVQVLHDLGTQISLREGCKEILFGDTMQLLETLFKYQTIGKRFSDELICSICEKIITPKDDGSVLLFFCRHAFHDTCIEKRGSVCPICNISKSETVKDKKKRKKSANI